MVSDQQWHSRLMPRAVRHIPIHAWDGLNSSRHASCRCSNPQGSAVDDPETPMTRAPADEEPFSALAFKVMADKYVGTLTFCRVYR